MKLTYTISGMTCSACQSKIHSLLVKVAGVKNVAIDLSTGETVIEMGNQIATDKLNAALKDYPNYQLSEKVIQKHIATSVITEEQSKPWIVTYKPVLLIFGYIAAITLLVEWEQGEFAWMRWMSHFMAGFFLSFSFFKLLNLKGFTDGYRMYDIVAKKWNGWGYVYAFTEVALGTAFLTRFNPLLTNSITFVIMAVSIIGVLQSVLNNRKIKCACLGDVFNVPMSTLTIIEDTLMIGMSGAMLMSML